MEAAVEIRARLDPLARPGRRQRQAQATRGDDALASTTLHVCATGVEQRFGKDPLALVRDHAQLSVIHLGLLSLVNIRLTRCPFRKNSILQKNLV
jgi:hypothetical protein